MLIIMVFDKITLGMKQSKYNLSYNTRDLVNTLARSASDRKCNIVFFLRFHFLNNHPSLYLGSVVGSKH